MSALEEAGEDITPPSRSASAMSSPAPPSSEHQRHWPLDLPSGLPFDRYEHRRITARDILVHRIISKVLFPTPDLSRALDDRRTCKSTPDLVYHCCKYHMRKSQSKNMTYHTFGRLRPSDRCLARDVEVLRKMLVTRSDAECVSEILFDSDRHWSTDFPSSQLAAPTVEEEVLDLVRRYYMETDDACTRLWLQSINPVPRSSYNTLPKQPAKVETHKSVVQQRRRRDEENADNDYKRWYDEDTAHLKALQTHTRTAGNYRLYEGGVLLPHLRKALFPHKVEREKFLQMVTAFGKRDFFTEEFNQMEVMRMTYPWPEEAAPRRVMHVPSWYSRPQRYDFWMNDNLRSVPEFEFASGRIGRGLDRDGVWSTARWKGDDFPRGRTARRGRRRVTSEPPPGLFMTAKLPVSFNSTREIFIFPKMSLATIDRRARHRSLSRTRVAEMFNWDAVLKAPPPHDTAWMKSSLEQTRDFKDLLHEILLKAATVETRLERLMMLYREAVDRFNSGLISMGLVRIAAWTCAPSSEPRIAIWPQWWVDVEKFTGVSMDEVSMDEELAADFNQTLNNMTNAPTSPPASLETGSQPTPVRPVLCVNCASTQHITSSCDWPCGYCGAANPKGDYSLIDGSRFRRPWRGSQDNDDNDRASQAAKHDNPHLAPNCPVAKQNRCKCVPFPHFHVAAKCPVLCSRNCGNYEHPPGHFKHKNAMSCKTRCCMCGIKGHSGMKCKWRRCRCGGEHLGQDCGWHPECRAKNCDRFLCGVHCQDCGVGRAQLGEGAELVGRRCPTCAETDGTSVVMVDDSGQLSRDQAVKIMPQDQQESRTEQEPRRRKNKRKHRPKAPRSPRLLPEKPWYAPLEPHTRPVASGKSGKKGTWDRTTAGDLAVRIGGCR